MVAAAVAAAVVAAAVVAAVVAAAVVAAAVVALVAVPEGVQLAQPVAAMRPLDTAVRDTVQGTA